jgi:hypothetical protein
MSNGKGHENREVKIDSSAIKWLFLNTERQVVY